MPLLDYSDELTYTAGPPATSKQSVIGAAGVALIGGRVKNGLGAKDWATGEVLAWYIRCVTALAGAGCTGVQFDLVVDTAATLVVAPTVIATKTVLAAAFVVNALIACPIATPGTSKQYLGVKMTPLGAASTAGEAIVGLIGKDARPQDGVNYL